MKYLFAVLLAVCFFFPEPSHAITIAPLKIDDVVIAPGDSGVVKIKIYNERETPATFRFVSQNFVAGEKEGEPVFLDETENQFGLASWFVFPAKTITLKPDEEQEVEVKIEVPVGAQPGGHYAAVFFESVDANASAGPSTSSGQGSGSTQKYRVGTLILLTVIGDYQQNGVIESFTTKNNQRVYDIMPVEFSLQVKNTGTVHFKPDGIIAIANMLGRETDKVPSDQLAVNVLPGGSRTVESWWPAVMTDAVPRTFWQKVNDEMKHFAFGRYTAIVSLPIGPQQGAVTAQTSFWVLPWHLMVTIVLTIVGVVGLMIGYTKLIEWRVRKNMGRAGGSSSSSSL